MHMPDSLISPVVGGVMIATSAAVAGYSIRKGQKEMDDSRIPLMGVMGAFVFAAQMINFPIPPGASGHLGGGLMLTALLGPYGGFLTMACILIIQAFVFGDGGLLALGCNIFNLGFFVSFVAYPLIYKPLTKKGMTTARLWFASLLTAVVGLQLGSLGVVFQTFLSGITELPLGTFLMFMQPIHLIIGIIEGIITAGVLQFIWKARPELLEQATAKPSKLSMGKMVAVLVVVFALTAGLFSWFASAFPDGLEWSIFNVAGTELDSTGGIHSIVGQIQEKTSVLPDYGFQGQDGGRLGTSVSGLVGGVVVLALAFFIGLLLRRKSRNNKSNE